MARVTIEDCIKKISNPFDLVLFATQRAKELQQGESSELNKNNDKDSVIALREIAKDKVSLATLKSDLIMYNSEFHLNSKSTYNMLFQILAQFA